MQKTELTVQDGFVLFPISDFREMQAWERVTLARAQRSERTLTILLRLLFALSDESRQVMVNRFLNDENNHLWKLLEEYLGDITALQQALTAVTEAGSLEEARMIAGIALRRAGEVEE